MEKSLIFFTNDGALISACTPLSSDGLSAEVLLGVRDTSFLSSLAYACVRRASTHITTHTGKVCASPSLVKTKHITLLGLLATCESG